MVRFLAVSDIHGTQAGFMAVQALAAEHEPDIILVAGDITHFGPAEWARDFLDALELPVLAVNGNCDTPDVAGMLASRDAGLLDRAVDAMGLTILGIGHPFRPGAIGPGMRFQVLLSHVPPHGCNDLAGGRSIGDHRLRELVLEHGPLLVVSGHVHESRGICMLGSTTCVNPGPARDGCGAVVDIDSGTVRASLVDAGTGPG